MTGSAIKLKARQMAEWVAETRAILQAKYEIYLTENGEMVTESHAEKLRVAVGAMLTKGNVFQEMAEAYFEGKTTEEFAARAYRHHDQLVYKTSGMSAMFKRARQRSAAAYAASPESEAYWAS
jgi:endo-alpha-1,4-polygalactosaminidase (GH114 family)